MTDEKRMIDAERLKETLLKDPTVKRARMEELVSRKIDNEPTQPCEPIIEARWERKNDWGNTSCTHCGARPVHSADFEYITPRCPYCGAHMKGTYPTYHKQTTTEIRKKFGTASSDGQEEDKQKPQGDIAAEALREMFKRIDANREGKDDASNDA